MHDSLSQRARKYEEGHRDGDIYGQYECSNYPHVRITNCPARTKVQGRRDISTISSTSYTYHNVGKCLVTSQLCTCRGFILLYTSANKKGTLFIVYAFKKKSTISLSFLSKVQIFNVTSLTIRCARQTSIRDGCYYINNQSPRKSGSVPNEF